MVYISLRMEHLTAGQVQGRIEHNERIVTRKDKDGILGTYVGKHEQINPEKTNLNYADPLNNDYHYMSTYLKQKSDELENHKQENPDDKEIQKRRMIGKNRNIAIEFVIQLGNTESGFRNCPEEDMNSFLHSAFKELQNKFPGQEILNMTIHQDELTPHLHVIMSHWNKKKKKWNQKGNFSNGKTFRYYQDWIGEVGKAFQKENDLDYDIKRGEYKETTKAVHQPTLHPNQLKQIKCNAMEYYLEEDPFFWDDYHEYKHKEAEKLFIEDTKDGELKPDDLVDYLFMNYYENPDILSSKILERIEKMEEDSLKMMKKKLNDYARDMYVRAVKENNDEYRNISWETRDLSKSLTTDLFNPMVDL